MKLDNALFHLTLWNVDLAQGFFTDKAADEYLIINRMIT